MQRASRVLVKALAMILLTQFSTAWATDPVDQVDPVVQIGDPTYQGSGCPDGTVSATLSPDATALSLIFDKYSVESGKAATGVRVDRKQCSFQIPMTIPAGYSVTVVRVDYRGYHSLPAGATATFQARYGFQDRRRGHVGRDHAQSFPGPVEGDFQMTQTSEGRDWSECDGEVQLQLDTALGVRSNPQGELAMASIDSADMTGERKMQYALAWRRCNGPELRPGQPGHPVGLGLHGRPGREDRGERGREDRAHLRGHLFR